MLKVKIFAGHYEKLEEEMNKWLSQQERIKIDKVMTKTTVDTRWLVIVILYRDGGS